MWNIFKFLSKKPTQNDVDNRPHIKIYTDSADISGFIPAKEMATMMIMLHGGDYATVLVNSIKLMAGNFLDKKDAEKYYSDFASSYEQLFRVEKKTNSPLVKPSDSFKGV